jgi:hypothetical protein
MAPAITHSLHYGLRAFEVLRLLRASLGAGFSTSRSLSDVSTEPTHNDLLVAQFMTVIAPVETAANSITTTVPKVHLSETRWLSP